MRNPAWRRLLGVALAAILAATIGATPTSAATRCLTFRTGVPDNAGYDFHGYDMGAIEATTTPRPPALKNSGYSFAEQYLDLEDDGTYGQLTFGYWYDAPAGTFNLHATATRSDDEKVLDVLGPRLTAAYDITQDSDHIRIIRASVQVWKFQYLNSSKTWSTFATADMGATHTFTPDRARLIVDISDEDVQVPGSASHKALFDDVNVFYDGETGWNYWEPYIPRAADFNWFVNMDPSWVEHDKVSNTFYKVWDQDCP